MGTNTFGSGTTFTNSGTVEIRSGTISLNGNYTHAPSSIHSFGIGGNAPGSYGRLLVNGTITLNGHLNLYVTNAFVPTNGAVFPVIAASSRVEMFGSLSGREIQSGLFFVTNYSPAGLALLVQDGTPIYSSAQLGMTNGIFQFRVQGVAGETYRVDASTNLTAWIPVATSIVPGSGFFDFSETITTNAPGRFYRVIFLP